MIGYLNGRFRYHTLRRWNRTNSYAHNVKIYNLTWKSKDDESKAYELISTAQAAQIVQKHLNEFNRQTDFRYSIISSGRSGGYLVLVKSERGKSAFVVWTMGFTLVQTTSYLHYNVRYIFSSVLTRL